MAVFLCPECNAPCKRSHRFCPACGHELNNKKDHGEHDDPFLGMTIGGKFVLRKLLGSGGMGNVYLADQKRVGRTAAVKIMHRHLLGDDRAAQRFINEARAASQLNHPHSISVLDFGQTEGGILYIVMEYLRGRSLDRVVLDEFPIPFGRVATILCQVLDAVEAAHHINIIHRDLKPENVFLDSTVGEDFVKVLDFGVAKMLEQDGHNITTPGLVPGTPEYMSPEQARGNALDGRSDVYSLGVILYEMLTGGVPFKGKSALDTMMAHVQDPPEPPSSRRPDRNVPPALDAIVLWALAKDVDERISSAAEFRDVLGSWAERSGLWPPMDDISERPMPARRRNLTEFFGGEELDDHDISGFGEHEQTHSTTRAKAELRPGGLDALEKGPILGRSAELDTLTRFVDTGNGLTLRLVGPSGSGKTRLVRKAIRMARSRGMRSVHCRVDPGWTAISLSPLRRVAASCLGLTAEGCTDEARVRQAAEMVGLEPEDIPGLKELFGIEDRINLLKPSERRRERAVAIRNLVQQAARIQPLILVFEDVDLYDQPSQELIAWLAAGEEDDELRILVTHEDSYMTSWASESAPLVLGPLEPDDAAAVVTTLLENLPMSTVMEEMVEQGNANPLYLQQRCLAEVFETIVDPPPNLADLLAARVERLGQPERELLQWMAVFNDWVSGGTLMQLLGDELDLELMIGLVEKGYLRQISGGYKLIHRLMAMVVYSTIPAEVRRNLHYVVGQHLSKVGAPLTTVAHHAHEADDGPQAMDALERAGQWAARCMDFHAATQLYRKATDIMRREWGKGRVEPHILDRKAVDLAHKLADSLGEIGDSLAARGILEETLSVAAADAADRATLRLALGRLLLDMGHVQQAVRHLKAARTDAQSVKMVERLSEVNMQLALAYGLLGQKDTARFLVIEAVQEVSGKKRGERRPDGWRLLLDAAVTCVQVGLHRHARQLLLESLQEAERAQSIPGKLRILLRMADVHRKGKEWQMAEMRLSQALNLLQTHHIGDRTLQAKLLIGLGRVRRIQGDVEEARTLLEDALDLAWRIGYLQGINRAESEMEMLRFALPPEA